MDRYYLPVSREEDDSIDHQYKVYDYSANEYQRSTKAMPSKMKTKYWLGKQQLRQKMGKEENEWVVKGDSSLDAKLSYFHHVNHSCNELLLLCDRLQHHLKGLSIQEALLGKFLDSRSKHEGTEAGKMMSYIGYAEEYMSKKRNSLYPGINRLMTDLGVFQQKAVQDCSFTVERMEQFRTEFRASLLWMENISKELNPEDREQLEKFRKVQSLTREKRVEFARMKDNTIQKIEILAASRINLLSARLEEYHNSHQKCLVSSINALKEVVAAKERLDAKIEEKRLADLEAEIDAHNPSKRGSKLYGAGGSDKTGEEGEEGTSEPPKLKDLKAPSPVNLSDDEDLVDLHDDFGDFTAAASKPTSNPAPQSPDQQETLDDIFGRLSPVQSLVDETDVFGLTSEDQGEQLEDNGGGSASAGGGGMVGEPYENWYNDFSSAADSQGGSCEALDWTLMNDILTQPDEDNLAGPATQQDLMHLSEALAGLDTGLGEAPLPTAASGDLESAEKSDTTPGEIGEEEQPQPRQQPPQMQPQQFNAWLNLFSDLDPLASQNKSSGNCA